MSSPTHSPSRDEPKDEFVPSAPNESDPADLPITDWMIRAFDATGRTPWVVGLGIAVVVFGISICFRFFWNEYGYRPNDALENPFFWVDTLFAVLIAYVATAHATERRGMLRDLSRLRPTLSGSSSDQIDRAREILCIEPRTLLIAGILGGSLMGVLPAIDDSYWTGVDPGMGDPSMLFLIVRNFVIGWIAGHALITEIQATRAYSRLGENGLNIDLLDLSPLAAFARKGQRGAITWLIASSLVSLFWLGPAGTDSNRFILVLILGLVTIVFFSPIYGAHRGIRRAKEAELGVLHTELRSLQAEERELPGDVALNSRIAAVAALHTTVKNARDWPVDAPALLRFGFFALLGLASWFGSAIVERLLDIAIG